MTRSTRRRLVPAVLVVIAGLAVAGADASRRQAWTTVDEPSHLAEARALRWGQGALTNPEQPVVLKVLAGVFLAPEKPSRAIDETRRGRIPFPFVLGLLVLSAGLWTSARSGSVAGIAVAALLALDPSLRGHGGLAKSDVLVALALLAPVAVLDSALRVRSPRRRAAALATAGLLYGVALASRGSALALLPLFVGAGALARRRGAPSTLPSRTGRAAALLLPALALFVALQEGILSRYSRSELQAASERQLASVPGASSPAPLFDALPKGVASYAAGLRYLSYRGASGKWLNYLFGRVSGSGWPHYFLVALALKLTTATVVGLLAASGALSLALARAAPRRRRRLLALAGARSALPGAFALAYLALFSLGHVQTGVRYAFPVLVFLLVAAAGAVRTAAGPGSRRLAWALLAVVVLSGAEAWAYRGREISFGNLLAGGPHGLRAALSDSNVEWGQEQGNLFERVRKGGLGRVGVVTLGLDWPEARRAGVAAWMSRPDDAAVDAVFVSTFYRDLAHALARYDEGLRYPWIAYVRSWLVPLVLTLESRAASVEPFGDGYLLLRLRPAAPGVAPPRAPVPATP